MTVIYVLTTDNVDHVSKQTGYSLDELWALIECHREQLPGMNVTIRVPHKDDVAEPTLFTWPKE